MAYNEAANKAAQEYKKKNIKRVPLDMQITEYENVKAAAASLGESINGFIKKAISMRMDNLAADDGIREHDAEGAVVVSTPPSTDKL